ncbi:MAG: site-specific DNA-methyltransferase [Lysobacteraceae bacterium]|nr:MAG: site-specific DNA-methyltransferase [Xanthomonadaceae bacterium]
MIIVGDAVEQLRLLPDQIVQTCVTSPPYWGLRDYGVDGQIGLEESIEEFLARLVEVFREVSRVLKPDGTLWVNMGDSYISSRSGMQGKTGVRKGRTFTAKTIDKSSSGLKPKDLAGVPWRLAFALQNAGWFLRSDIVWAKPNVIPESIKDRPCRAHEYIFLFAKQRHYFYDHDAIREPYSLKSLERLKTPMQDTCNRLSGRQPGRKYQVAGEGYAPNPLGRNKRDVWTVPTQSFKDAHFATFPPDLIKPCILAGSRPNDIVLDPFFGAGTTGLVAVAHRRNYIGIELNPDYAEIARKRINEATRQQVLCLE